MRITPAVVSLGFAVALPLLMVSSVEAKPLAHVSNLTLVGPHGSRTPGTTLTFRARAQGHGSTPDYQFAVQQPNGAWRVVRNWSSSNIFHLPHVKPGSYPVRVAALDATQLHARLFKQALKQVAVVDVGSTVSATVDTPQTPVVGQALPITAHSLHLVRPVYELAVQNPNGQWSTGTFSVKATASFIPTQTGTYHYQVVAKDAVAPAQAAYETTSSGTFTVGVGQTSLGNLPGQPYYDPVGNVSVNDGSMTMNGTNYSNGLQSWGGQANFLLSGNYSQFTALVGLDDSGNTNAGTVTFTDQRGQTLASETIQPGQLPVPVSFSVQGVNVLIVTIDGSGDLGSIDVVNPTVTSATTITLPSAVHLTSNQVYLDTLRGQPYYDPVDNVSVDSPPMEMAGTTYAHGLQSLGGAQANFALGRTYSQFTALVGLDDSGNTNTGTVTFTDQRGQTLASETIQPGQLPVPVSFSVQGVNVLIVTIDGSGDLGTIDVVNPILTK